MTLKEYKRIKLAQYKQYCYDVTIYDEIEELFLKKYIVSAKPEMFIDVGFNWGGMSDLALNIKPDIEVIGFEPDKRNYRIAHNCYKDRVELHNVAVSNKNGYSKLYQCDDTTQSGMRYNIIDRYSWGKTVKLDNYYKRFKDKNNLLFKIDTEGTEPEVILGMQKILKNFKGSLGIIFEYSFKWLKTDKEMQEFLRLFLLYGFKLYRLNAFGLEEISYDAIFYLKQFHYSLLFAIRGIKIDDDKEHMPKITSMAGFIPVCKDFTIEFRREDEII